MDVSKYFNQTAIYKKYKYKTGKGEEVYEKGVPVKLRLEQVKKTIINSAGKTQSIEGTYMIGRQGLKVGDILEYSGKEYKIIDVEEIIDKKARFIYAGGNLI